MSSTTEISTSGSAGGQRRVGRVERWLRKGYGFIIDMGRLDADDTKWGFVKDDMSGQKAFVYHNALRSDSEDVFHRLFANEYVEYNIDLERPRRDGRLQAFDVSGIYGSELLCDLNAAAAAAEESEENSTPVVTRSRRSHTGGPGGNGGPTTRNTGGHGGGGLMPSFVPPAGATVVYYVPAPGSGGQVVPSVPSGLPQAFPASAQQSASEPSYVMPASGIPVPK